MLSTNEKAVGLGARNWYFPNTKKLVINSLESNLYILSDDKIKEGDYYFDSNYRLIMKASKVSTNTINNTYKKVIVTTDSSLSLDSTGFVTFNLNTNKTSLLPQIPQQFIEHYINEYNKDNQIENVMVDYEEERYSTFSGQNNSESSKDVWTNKLKINSDNTINIKPVKDSWDREEVISLIDKFDTKFADCSKEQFDKWIEDNL
jgi:hypothetical protein